LKDYCSPPLFAFVAFYPTLSLLLFCLQYARTQVIPWNQKTSVVCVA